MGSSPGTAQQSGFQERLKRIEQRGPNTLGKVYVGDGGSVDAKKSRKAKNTVAKPQKSRRSFAAKLVGVTIAGTLGFGAVLIARVALFHLLGLRDPMADPVTQLWQEGGAALGAGFLLALIFGTLRKGQLLMLVFGLGAGLTLGHNTVHMAPHLWDQATSPVYTNKVMQSAMPRSAVLLDKMILF
ncbi:hypothetical protein ACP2AV_07435 [Aliiroseovarius sp. PTFE2010]|uniref:hypothetical protein n=1 Tax=Aliiroseovarius sp. PTFE2010 TaxID=3417190 RepID=UPI003CE8E6F2